ncbi:MATE family efflux transporter [Fusibacter sp. 3D3]|uniref:MATE family efflux transporter n=1 Tax=Fusibacter sp. 3D3 TaxID=1048380 RepID=UPI000852CA14|nr:MATE family efflux transporter [Fusibacter sp. 3D3]GAU76571.1 DNA-damage-inducible protein [Fusibacter sp. 3D3]
MTHKAYLSLAIPLILSTVTQPLLGAVDTAIIGRLDNSAYIGGVAIGAVIFNTIYWLFGFLRVSTSSFSAQSYGSQKASDTYYAYFRPLMIAGIVGLVFVLFQGILAKGAVLIYNPDSEVIEYAMTYFRILIWGAPCVLIGYVNIGWLMGRKHVKETLFLQISANVLNIVLDAVFVLHFKMGIAGVAYATLISQAYSFLLGSVMISKKIDLLKAKAYWEGMVDRQAIKDMMRVNRDLMIRTTCLLIMTNMFMNKGSELGTDILAANAVLFQIQYIISYIFDGLSNASSIYTGKSVGEGNQGAFKAVMEISSFYTIIFCFLLSGVSVAFQSGIIGLFTNIESVIMLCKTYFIWIVIFPYVIGIGMVYYGIYTGSTFTGPVRNSLIIALGIFVLTYMFAIPKWGNHGLWLAFILFSLTRSVVLVAYKNKLFQKTFLVVCTE